MRSEETHQSTAHLKLHPNYTVRVLKTLTIAQRTQNITQNSHTSYLVERGLLGGVGVVPRVLRDQVGRGVARVRRAAGGACKVR